MNKDKRPPVMIGGGGHAVSLAAMAPAECRPVRYVDTVHGNRAFEWLGDDDKFLSDNGNADDLVIVTFVAPRNCSLVPRRKIIEKYSSRRFATVISPSATIAPDVFIGEGSAVFPGAIVNTGAVLGSHAIVNTGAIVEHGVIAGTNVFFGPGSVVAGDVTVGENVYIGAGVSVRNTVKISDNVTIGVGAAVVSDLTEPGVYAGVPARLIKKWKTTEQ